MKKTPTIFVRDEVNRKIVTKEVNPVCQWVFDGEGVATRKYDGTCCKIENNVLYKRREVKKGKQEPDGFDLVSTDDITGKKVGWVKVSDTNEDQWHRQGFDALENKQDGTYELCGPKVQGNPENYESHVLIRHATAEIIDGLLITYDEIRDVILNHSPPIEGIVYHHPDGRMAKIKARDFN